MVLSPWTTGGWVCSETFDHTSLIRFMEQRFGVHEPNITDWRRAVCGDFTSAFDFGTAVTAKPSLPSVAGLAPTDRLRHPSYVPTAPAQGSMPTQEHGTRPSRALAYHFDIKARVSGMTVVADFANDGDLGVHVQVRSNAALPAAPHSYTTGAHATQQATWDVSPNYDLSAHGPDGFFRRWAGATATSGLEVESSTPGKSGELHLDVRNGTSSLTTVTIADAYGATRTYVFAAGQRRTVVVSTTQGWYDVTLTSSSDSAWARQLAGRIHTGDAGISDPQLGR